MNRLRVRVELNRRRAGVPMNELVSVVEETHKFFQLLAEDVHIESGRGEWHASNFDPESLNFSAEFDGPASAEQIAAFGSSFAGATSLRRETIAQFTRIADFIGEDEMVGFGLYQNDQETEPSDWRCLSRQDAMRFADEIRLLAKASGEAEQEAPLPAVMNGSVGGRRLFKDRRERETLSADPSKWIREVESNLARRIALLEGEIESQARRIQTWEPTPQADEERFYKMLSAMQTYQSRVPPLMLNAPAPSSEPLPNPRTVHKARLGVGWAIAVAFASMAIVVMAAITVKSIGLGRPARPVEISSAVPAPQPKPVPVSNAAALTPAATPAPAIPTVKPEPVDSDSAARRDAAPEMEHQFAMEVPPDLRPLVGSEVLVNLIVGVDREGKVTTADVLSTRGGGAEMLVPEALKAARWFHFRPARQGKKTVPSKTMLSFTFNAD